MRNILMTLFVFGVLINFSCTKQIPGNNGDNGSSLTQINIGGVSVETLPWNAEYKAKSKEDKEQALTKIGFGFRLIMKSSDAKCQSANYDGLKVNSYVVPEQTVTRGCKYDLTLTFGSTKEADKPANPNATPKEFLKTLLAATNGATSYQVPTDSSKPSVSLNLCPTSDSVAYFDPKVCTASDPNLNADLDVDVKFGNPDEKRFAHVKIKSVDSHCVIDDCQLLNKADAQKVLDLKDGALNCEQAQFIIPNKACMELAAGSPFEPLDALVQQGKAYKSGYNHKLP